MSTSHTVRSGECLSSIAKAYGFADWHRIYDAPENASFKQARPNPDLIYPGDVVVIPDTDSPAVSLGTGQNHVIEIGEPTTKLRLVLEVTESYQYELTIDGNVISGSTDGKSPIEQPIRPDLAEATLTVWPASATRDIAKTWTLLLGVLDPVDELSGVQGRLQNLGYYSGPLDGRSSAECDDAIARFQDDEKLDTSSGLTDETRERLRKRHDGS